MRRTRIGAYRKLLQEDVDVMAWQCTRVYRQGQSSIREWLAEIVEHDWTGVDARPHMASAENLSSVAFLCAPQCPLWLAFATD